MRFSAPTLSLLTAAVLDPKALTESKASQVSTLRPFVAPTAGCETATIAIG